MNMARVIAVVTTSLAAIVATASGAAASSAPESWPVGESLSTLETLAYFVGIPVLLFAVIWGLAAAVAAKSRNFVPTIPTSTEIEKAPGHDVAH